MTFEIDFLQEPKTKLKYEIFQLTFIMNTVYLSRAEIFVQLYGRFQITILQTERATNNEVMKQKRR